MARAILVLAAVLLVLSGCKDRDPPTPPDSATPIVRANDGASASVIIVTCPPSEARAMAVGELIDMLTRQGELAIARQGGTARFVLNACPSGVPAEVLVRRR